MKSPTLEDIQKAEKAIREVILHTPLKRSNYFSDLFLKNIF